MKKLIQKPPSNSDQELEKIDKKTLSAPNEDPEKNIDKETPSPSIETPELGEPLQKDISEKQNPAL